MAGHQITLSRVVHADPERVWAVLTDLDHAPETLRGVTRIERVAGPAYDVGTTWRESRRLFGREETQEMTVSEVIPRQRTTVTAATGGVDYTTVFTLAPREDGTEITMTFGADHPDPTLLQRVTSTVLGPVGIKVTSRLLTQDLEDIARRAEHDSTNGSEDDAPRQGSGS